MELGYKKVKVVFGNLVKNDLQPDDSDVILVNSGHTTAQYWKSRVINVVLKCFIYCL